MTVPRPDALQNLHGKILKLEPLREVKLSVGFKLGHMRPTAGHQKANDVSPFRLVDGAKGRTMDKTISAISRSTLVF